MLKFDLKLIFKRAFEFNQILEFNKDIPYEISGEIEKLDIAAMLKF